ncbi:hypothetical protein ASE30_09030 [Achromobacter sp. Root83]|nr:hypothetical protein ASE30_09030 [Achromobacter sp. Root83]
MHPGAADRVRIPIELVELPTDPAGVTRVGELLGEEMNIRLKGLAAVAAYALMAGAVQAQSAQLNITGRVVAASCTISVGAVAFGDVPIANFTDSQYAKTFQVTLGNCDMATLTRASVTFAGTIVPEVSNSTGLALNDASTRAQGVAVSVYINESTHGGSVGTAVRFDGATAYPFLLASGKNTYDFQAKLVPVPGVALRTGTANATATVTLSYA